MLMNSYIIHPPNQLSLKLLVDTLVD